MRRPLLLLSAFALLPAAGCMGPGPNVAPEAATSRVPPPRGAPLIGAEAPAGSYRSGLPAVSDEQ